MSLLRIGKTYQFYTKFETIFGVKAKVIGILSYEEAKKVSFDMNVLAINEKVISVADENLEELLADTDIYYCRAINSNADGSYSEYIVWDSIIDTEKTVAVNTKYTYNLNITILDTTNVPINQIISDIETFVKSSFGTTINFSITDKTSTDDNITSTTNEKTELEEKIAKYEAILNSLNKLSNKFIPAAEKLNETDLAAVIETIYSELTSIKNDISSISSALH